MNTKCIQCAFTQHRLTCLSETIFLSTLQERMSIRHYLIIMSLGTALSITALIFIVFGIDPYEAKLTGLFFFYSTFFISVIGLFSVIGFLIRWAVIKNKQVMLRHVRKTFRQSITIASLLTISLLFMQFDLLRWWNTLILVALFIIIEGLIFTNRKYHNQEYVA